MTRFKWENQVETLKLQNEIIIKTINMLRIMINEDTMMTMNLIIEVSAATSLVDFLLSIKLKV